MRTIIDKNGCVVILTNDSEVAAYEQARAMTEE